jgi:hypothetical protein
MNTRSKSAFVLFSQGMSSASNFLNALGCLWILDGAEFKKWLIYSGSTFAVQGILRSTLLEPDLHHRKGLSSRTLRKLRILCFLPCLLVPIVAMVTQSTVHVSDLLIVLFCIFSLAEDGLRYNNLGRSPVIAFKADLIWFLFTVTPVLLFIFGANFNENQFLSFSIFGPISSFLYLMRKNQISHGMENEYLGSMDRLFLFLGSTVLTISTITFTTLIARFESEAWLREWRTVVLLVSPIQAFSSILWLRKLIESSQNESLENTLRSMRSGLIKSIPVLATFVAGASFLPQLILPDTAEIDLTVLFIAMSIPVINAVMYPSNLLMRSMGMYGYLFILVSLNSLVLPLLVWHLRNDLNLNTLFGVQLLSILLLHFTYITIAKFKPKRSLK